MRIVVMLSLLSLILVGCGRATGSKGGKKSNVTPNNSNVSTNVTPNNDTSGGGGCGDGVVGEGEFCDPGIEDGDGVCPNTCQTPPGTCGTFSLVGSDEDCSARCELEPAACGGGDDCCPVGCDASTDDDCTNTCGDGVLEAPEVCDGNCPQDCDDGNACTNDSLNGSPDTCSAVCSYSVVTQCANDDGCCPAGCDSGSDNDCSDQCGNGVVDAGETCDGDCPTSCDDGNSCTIDSLAGSAETCSASCVSSQITSCTGGDMCCPAGCTSQTDADCNCAPTTSCPALGYDCGSLFNGCADVSCGQCSGTEVCINNVCEETFGIGDACQQGGSCAGCIDEEGSGWDGGYCTRNCSSDSECGAGGHCGPINPDAGVGVCFKSCSTNADCPRAGYECFDFDNNGDRECAPTGTGNRAVGEACDTVGDCSGGQGASCLLAPTVLRDGYCSRRCTSSADCGSGAHCSSQWGLCLQTCTSSGQCRSSGYSCYDADDAGQNECWQGATGNGQVGDPCVNVWDCAGEEFGFCLDEANSGVPGGYCIVTCEETVCPAGSECIDLGGGNPLFCMETCPDGTCDRGDYACYSPGTPAVDVCWL